MDKFHPGYFGKVGMRHFHLLKNRTYCKAVNVDKLWSLLGEGVLEQAKAGGADKAPVLDVTKLGFFKVLGKGKLPSVPLVVKAKYFSKDVSTYYNRLKEKACAFGHGLCGASCLPCSLGPGVLTPSPRCTHRRLRRRSRRPAEPRC